VIICYGWAGKSNESNQYKVEKYKACATSAMREAYNGKEVVEIIKNKSEVEIDSLKA
jgi:exopolyphosphatase/pppGpp-phosphohydrolase